MKIPASAGGAQGTHYSYAQLMGLWENAGGSKTQAALAAAIAEAESGGWSGVQSSNPDGGTNVGLWQLDTKGVGAGHSVAQLSDPATNAQITVKGTQNGKNWSEWQTFTTGAYKAFMSNRTTADTNVPSPKGTTSSSSTGGGPCPDYSLWCIPAIGWGPFKLGPITLFTKQNARAWAALALMGVGGLGVLVFGAVTASALGVNPAGKLGQAAGGVTEGVGAPVAAAGAQIKRHGATRAAQQAAVRRGRARVAERRAEERNAERTAGQLGGEQAARAGESPGFEAAQRTRAGVPRGRRSTPNGSGGESSRARAARYTRSSGRPASPSEAGF